MDLISIIIPVYNVEKYLKHCLESVLHQTYNNLQIILVDDGSTDTSGLICDIYCNRDDRITVIHQENSGVSYARNIGIEIASGKYITFVDSDDMIDREYVNCLYNQLMETGSDISVCRYKRFLHVHDLVNREKSSCTVIYNNLEALKVLLYSPEKITQASYAKMYKRSLFDDIRYPIDQINAEDTATTYKLFYKATKISYNPSQYYFYLQRMDGLVRSEFTKNKLDLLKTSDKIIEFAKEKAPSIEKAAICYAFAQNIQLLIMVPYKDKKYQDVVTQLILNIRKYRKTILLDSNVKWTKRLGALACYTNPLIIRELAILYKKIINKEPIRKGV